jgi:hypothetical protein
MAPRSRTPLGPRRTAAVVGLPGGGVTMMSHGRAC